MPSPATLVRKSSLSASTETPCGSAWPPSSRACSNSLRTLTTEKSTALNEPRPALSTLVPFWISTRLGSERVSTSRRLLL
ncbi:hypothetical protein D3C78_1513930 [compost metagenome]